MSQALKTEKCVVCGKLAILWHGHVIAKERMPLGNLIDKKIIAGFCEEHFEDEGEDYYGEYNSNLMGNCVPLFGTRKMDLFKEE